MAEKPEGQAERPKRRDGSMLIATIVMGVLAAVLVAVAYARGGNVYAAGLKSGGQLTLQVLPMLAFAFVVAGMVQVLVPSEVVARWVGTESGLRGIMLGTLVGAVTPGGPYVTYPIVAGLYRAGAGVGTLVAFVTAWSLWAVARMPMEVALMGVKFTLVRFACTFLFAPIAGLIAHVLFRNWY